MPETVTLFLYAACPGGEGVAWKAMGCNSLAGSNPVRSAKYVVCPGVRKLFRKQSGVKSLAGSSPVRDAKTGTYGGRQVDRGVIAKLC